MGIFFTQDSGQKTGCDLKINDDDTESLQSVQINVQSESMETDDPYKVEQIENISILDDDVCFGFMQQ